MPDVDLSRVHFPVTSLGFGRRVGIWMQGCSIRCPGCVVPETWDATDYHRVRLEDLYVSIERWVENADGITISGGEPFDQPEALLSLLTWLNARASGRDVLVYSGYPLSTLKRNHRSHLQLIDVLVSEPFVASLPDDRAFVGSSNQKVNLLTPLAQDRYTEMNTFERRFDVALRNGLVLLAGVPRRGELRALAEEIAAEGELCSALTHEAV